MWSFLSDLFRKPGVPRTLVVLDEEGMGRSRRYQVRPRRLLFVWGGTLFGAGLVVAGLLAFTPLRALMPGGGSEELQRDARLNAVRVSALQDSIAVQRKYIERLQHLMTGQVDSVAHASSSAASAGAGARSTRSGPPSSDATDEAADAHEQPAFSVSNRAEMERPSAGNFSAGDLPSLGLPVLPPVENGFPTRNFDARDTHYGIDIAVSEGTHVRTVAEGYVVLADWTQGGGYTIAVQHADGYLSVYKHNKRLLKQTGDHVQAQEALAVSGNTGEMTTGPHVHFELWRNGLAQDPRSYVTGW